MPAREQRQLGDFLGDAHLERIDEAERRADRRGAGTHGHRDEGAESEALGEQQEDRHEGDQLLLHLDEDAAQAEGHAGNRDHEEAASRESRDQPVDQLRQRTGPLDHREGSAHEKDVEHDGGGISHTARNPDQRLEGPDRAGLHPFVGPGHDDVPAGGRILAAFELSGG